MIGKGIGINSVESSVRFNLYDILLPSMKAIAWEQLGDPVINIIDAGVWADIDEELIYYIITQEQMEVNEKINRDQTIS